MDLLCYTLQAFPASPWVQFPGVEACCDRFLAAETPTELLHLWVRLIAQQTCLTTRGLHHSNLKVLGHLSTVLYSAKASWKALEKLSSKGLAHLPSSEVSEPPTSKSPGMCFDSRLCVSVPAWSRETVPATRNSTLLFGSAPPHKAHNTTPKTTL